ncbi:putative glycolipid-binding domain-containing protein [Roseibium sp. RKSG952]|uniref:putative glycolipid-binding domain-containing protein n=1 Tax=Roseibium sp. RKSG952 TaxID=2529384 RepID=UPI0012BD121C|nr:putative glycolipid-binding domain-containing protein [Roseibium sp. RKSG952]MTI01337.1 hypothetical protein [Roseibium sp. RKSG952]
MTGRAAIATAHWRRLDQQGTDRCTLSQLDSGWILVGQAIWHDSSIDHCLTYDVRCDPDWHSLSADVGGEFGGRDIALRLHRTAEGWFLNDKLQENTAECIDLDLSFTPATNLLPLRRLGLRNTASAPVKAAWLKPDLASIAQLDQIYSCLSQELVRYSSTNFEADLQVHSSGFVTHYPELWEGWVDA